MKRILILAVLTGLGLTSAAEAQVFVRAPLVRVQVGPPGTYTYVRAPFVNLFVPEYSPPIYYGPPIILNQQPQIFVPPAPTPLGPPMQVEPPIGKPVPLPQNGKPALENPDLTPPQPLQNGQQTMTLDQFAKSFQPKAGNYEVTLLNPVTGQATPVRFSLPEGTPRRVHVRRTEIEFDYGIRRFVRIEFDRDGAQVVAR